MTFEAKFSNENARELFCPRNRNIHYDRLSRRTCTGQKFRGRTDSLINTSLDIHARRYRRSSSNLRLTTGRFETELRIKAAKANIGNVEREPIGSVPGNFPNRVGKKVTSRGEWNFLYVYQRENSLVICFLC